MRKIDLTGKIFGHLTVIQEAPMYISPKGYKKSMWLCQCDCGNECVVMGSHLTSGHSTSCGCQQTVGLLPRIAKDLVGQRFGMLTVMYRQPNRMVGKNSRVVWHCKCDCGKETDVIALLLFGGLTKSCGCLSVSHAERIMSEYLVGKDVSFDTEYAPSGLKGIHGGSLRFDFVIYTNNNVMILIELDGEQHHKPVKYFGGTPKYESVSAHDELKEKWARQHNILLIRINIFGCKSDLDFISLYDKIFQSYNIFQIDK